MYAASSPSDPLIAPGAARADGAVRIAFDRAHGRTRLARLYQRTPMRVLLPKPALGDLTLAALVNVGGGLVAGDRASVEVRVGEGAAVLVTSQAAEKVYRSTAADTVVENRSSVASGGWLEWCPQETILFDQARLRRSLRLDVEGDACATLGEMLVLGRHASGERARQGLLHDVIEVRHDRALVWQDRLRLVGDYEAVRAAPAGLNGATALATFVHAGPDAARWLDLAREQLTTHPVPAGATLVDGLLIARWLGSDALALRRSFAQFWGWFRAAVAGLPPALPRFWHV